MNKIKNFIINYKFLFLYIFFTLYFIINFFDGDRGYFSYKKKIIELSNLEKKLNILNTKFEKISNQNIMLSKKIDKGYLDQIYRELFVVGKKNEQLYLIK